MSKMNVICYILLDSLKNVECQGQGFIDLGFFFWKLERAKWNCNNSHTQFYLEKLLTFFLSFYLHSEEQTLVFVF